MARVLGSAIDTAFAEFNRKRQAESYFSDPVLWADYMLGMKLWSAQREVAKSLMENKSVAVKAGHGVGKSLLAAVLICHWIDTRYPDVFVASTAPSQAQIGAIVWREVRSIKDLIEKRFLNGEIDHKLPGYITSLNEWKTDSGSIIGFGRRPPEQKEESAVQGIHARYVLAVGDEAVGLSEEMIDALSNITSNTESRRLLISNPTNPASHVGKIFKENSGVWALHTISVLDSPNFTDERFEMPEEALSKLTGPEYVEDKRKEYGEDSARYKARVLGEFAFDSDNSLFSAETVEKAKSTDINDEDVRPTLGVDVARFGGDRSVVYSCTAGRVRLVEAWEKAATTETANRVHRIALDLGADVVNVDADGVGGGVKDQLVQLANGLYTVIEIHGSASSPDRRQWHNFRAYAWDNFRLRCSEGKIDIDPHDEDLQDELLAVQYTFQKQSGGLLIESKDDMRSRGIRSPDLADAAIYSSLHFDLDDPLLGYESGDKVHTSATDIIGDMPYYLEVITDDFGFTRGF